MIFHRYVPRPPLGEFIEWLWYYDDFFPSHRREHVLPDGTFELVIELRGQPRNLFHRHDATRHESFRHGWLSGSHSEYIVIDALPDSSMIGAHFRPGGATPFLGLPADELRDRVCELDTFWGRRAWDLREQLLAKTSPRAKFQCLEQFLVDRLKSSEAAVYGRARVAWAVQRFVNEPHRTTIADVVGETGISHKHFIDEFRRHVGLTPKLFCRIQRFRQVLSEISHRRTVDWADVASSCGYFDQAHFVHDFQAFAGLNPTVYLRNQPGEPRFVPVGN